MKDLFKLIMLGVTITVVIILLLLLQINYAHAASHTKVDPVQEIFTDGTPVQPGQAFSECKIYTRLISVEGNSYVLTGLQCRDDNGHWVIVN